MDTYLLALPLIAFLISFFTSQAGVSGAFLILPLQISFLGFTTPAVSSTNLLYNIISIPSGVLGYLKEKRFMVPLTAAIVAGTLPGIFIGALIRITYLPDPKSFKLFAGFVLLFLGLRLLLSKSGKFGTEEFRVKIVEQTFKKVSFEFAGKRFSFQVPLVFAVSLFVGVVSGTYGVGGGAFMSPFLISVLGLPAYTIAGSTLFATFLTSIFGVLYYTGLGYPPNLLYAILLGIGGMVGMYAGSRMQKFVPERLIRVILASLILVIAVRYILQYFA